MPAINVLGFGVMGKQISALCQVLGFEVRVWCRRLSEGEIAKFERGRKIMTRRFTPGEALGSVHFFDQIAELRPAMTFEALVEDLEVKREVIARLPRGEEEFDLFTNTSSYSPSEIHESATGLHFFNPIHALKFIELSRDTGDLKPEGEHLIQQLESQGFEVIRTSDNRGYIGNTILFQEIAAALGLAEVHGYRTESIDRVLAHMGRSVSLFSTIDLIGVDTVQRILENLSQVDPGIRPSPLLERALTANVLGKKNGTSIRDVIDA